MSNVILDPKGQEILDQLASLELVVSTKAKQDEIITALGNITSKAQSATEVTVAQSITSVVLLAANANRKQLLIRNNAQGNQVLYIALRPTATTSSVVALTKGSVFIDDIYTGVVSGIWSAAGTGNAIVCQATNP
jgi:hypothetical protein